MRAGRPVSAFGTATVYSMSPTKVAVAGEALAARGHQPGGGHPAQQPRSGDESRAAEQYVRLRVQVRGDRMTVLDSHLDGPLTAPTTLRGAGV